MRAVVSWMKMSVWLKGCSPAALLLSSASHPHENLKCATSKRARKYAITPTQTQFLL